MRKRNGPDPPSGAREQGGGTSNRQQFMVIPRRWLLTLGALIVVPWLIAAAFYSRASHVAAPLGGGSAAERDALARVHGDRRPWGRLVLTPIRISPPLEYVPSSWGSIEAPRWYFHQATREQVEQFLAAARLGPQQVSQVVASLRAEGEGLVATPEPRLVRDLSPEVRAAIYRELASHPRNDRQRNAYRYYGSSVEDWLGQSLMSPRTRQLVEPLIYRIGDFLYMADIDLIRAEIADPAELQRLAKALFREATLLVELRLEDSTQLDAAVEYWGRGGRRTDIRPLLESLMSSSKEASVDISHLLPAFAREYLYRYPRITLGDLDKPGLVNCFWTALNFFNVQPDDRYLDARVAIERLKRDYFIVHDNQQLGDIAAFVDPAGEIFHAAVYLADGLVFGKNGTSHLSPWSVIPLERLKGYYVEHADHWQVVFYRRKDV